jgi:hypothetical protein
MPQNRGIIPLLQPSQPQTTLAALGKQTSSQATLARAIPSILPFHKNTISICSINRITLLGRIKILV